MRCVLRWEPDMVRAHEGSHASHQLSQPQHVMAKHACKVAMRIMKFL